MRGFDCDTGDMWSLSCGANVCPFCIETNIWLTAKAFAHSSPTRYVVFTGLGTDDWQTNRVKIKALLRRLDRAGYDVRASYTIEKNPAGTGWHLNLWWWSACCPADSLCKSGCRGFIPQHELVAAAESMGWGRVTDVRRWNTRRGNYGMKEASGSTYGMKEAQGHDQVLDDGKPRWLLTEAQADYLRRNGGRLLGARPSFWRDGQGGASLGSKRATLEAVRAAEGREKRRRQSWVVYAGSEVLAESSPVVDSRASGTSPVVPMTPGGSPSTAEPPSPGSQSDGDQCVLEVGSTLSSSRRVTNTYSRSRRTARSTAKRSRWTPPSPSQQAALSVTRKPPVSGSSSWRRPHEDP